MDAAVSVRCPAAAPDCVTSLSWCCVGAMVVLLSRHVALDAASVNVRLSVGRGFASLVARRAVMRLAVSRRGCGLCQSSVQLPRPASSKRDGTTPVSTCLARHCRGQRLSVRRTLMGVQAYRQPAPTTSHVRCMSTSCHPFFPSTLNSVSCRRWLTRSRSLWISGDVVDAVPPCRRRTFTSATSSL